MFLHCGARTRACRVHTRVNAWDFRSALVFARVRTRHAGCVRHGPNQPKAPAPDSFVSVRFDIDEKGLPINIQVDRSSGKELEDEVIALIRE